MATTKKRKRSDRDIYRPLAMMTVEDFNFNISRLEKEAAAKQFHADALARERDARIQKGLLSPQGSAN